MARVALTAIVLFALPFLVYALYVIVRGRKAALQKSTLDKAPVRGLIVAGVASAVAGVIGFAILTQSAPDYEPPVGPRAVTNADANTVTEAATENPDDPPATGAAPEK